MNAEHRFRRLLWIGWVFSGLALAAVVYVVALRHTGMAMPYQVGWSVVTAFVVAWVWSPWEPPSAYVGVPRVSEPDDPEDEELQSLLEDMDDDLSQRLLDESAESDAADDGHYCSDFRTP
jgi:hypothetical protein